jgi:hypothetical protein
MYSGCYLAGLLMDDGWLVGFTVVLSFGARFVVAALQPTAD